MSAKREAQTVIELPAPNYNGAASLEEAFQRRRSVREFTREALTLAQISQLLWACQGLTGAGQGRAAPSAGATDPLEVYLVRAEGVDHYDPRQHQLLRLTTEDLRPALCKAALSQEFRCRGR